MNWKVRALNPLFGAELSGCRVKDGLNASAQAELSAALSTYGVLVLPDQDLDDDHMERFAASMGEIDDVGRKVKLSTQTVYRMTNILPDGSLAGPDHPSLQINVANRLWHTDSTYTQPGSTVSMLHARVVPPVGGETQYCDTRVAYDRLDGETKARLEPLVGHHALQYSRRKCGWTDDSLASLGAVARPLVHRHGPSGRMVLCIASHIGVIEGLEEDEAMALLDRLIEAATEPEVVYTHSWAPKDFVLWDNRCTMHRATTFDLRKYGRDMRAIRLADTGNDRLRSSAVALAMSH
jgi:alpha-ketoglutarate-dependent 2,4-dichlorophenoxyacetate dioxygenase